MKKSITKKHLFAEIAGWYGALAILTGYTLVSFEVINSDTLLYQLLNLTGALGIIAIASYKRVAQSIVLNIVWLTVALFAIINIFV